MYSIFAIRSPLKDWVKDFFNGKVRNAESMPYRLQLYSGLRAPLSHCFHNPVVSDKYARPSVIRLSNAPCPSAIFRVVTKIIVNSVKRMTNGALSHIFKKVTEAVSANPSVANGNTSSSVINKMLGSFSKTSAFHFTPRPIKLVPLSIFTVTVGCVSSFADLCLEASARGSMPTLKVTPGDSRFIPTVADAIPFDSFCTVVAHGHHNQTPKSHTNQVNWFSHFVTSKYCHHVKVWKAAVKPLFRLQTLSTEAFYAKTLAGPL